MIEIKNLTKCYGKQTLFADVRFTFPDSGLVCLLGPSGCGKSTLLNILAGFDSHYSGSISVLGMDIHTMNAADLCAYRKDHIGFVFQDYNLLSGYTALENILSACALNRHGKAQYKEKALTLLNKLNIAEKADEKTQNLSGGQKQRVAIARALINDPCVIFADEPTGALDRKNSNELMALFKELSKDRLILVITHDQKICAFADKIVSIQDGKLRGDETADTASSPRARQKQSAGKGSVFCRGAKNFKVHLARYIAVALSISIGVLAFMLSLSSANIMGKSVADFKEKNTAFNNGYIKSDHADETLALLRGDPRIENVYAQYMIKNVTLSLGEKTETIAEKYPMPKATEAMSYGVMPQMGEKQIALSPSLAKKFDSDIKHLIGKELRLTLDGTEYNLTICGIFNAGYDDFFVSADVEQKFYLHTDGQTPYSVSYDVQDFADIASVNQSLTDKGIEPKTAAQEVGALQSTFENLRRLFAIVSILILSIGLVMSSIVLVKLQSSRYREVGLLSALGWSQNRIRRMLLSESLLLSASAIVCNAVFMGTVYCASVLFKIDLVMTAPQILLSLLGTGLVVILLSILAAQKLIHTEPAAALRK